MTQLSGLIYRCAAKESFDSVALAIYGDEKYAAGLMDANPEYCGMTVFAGGEKLLLPVLDAPDDDEEAAMANTVAPWKQ